MRPFAPLPHDQDGLLTLSVVTAVLPFAAFYGDLAFVVQHCGELPLLRRNCSGEKCLEGGCHKLQSLAGDPFCNASRAPQRAG